MTNPNKKEISIFCVTSDGKGASYFSTRQYPLEGEPSRMLTDRIDAQNFRLRTSHYSYASDWHVAGDPTLLILLKGTLRIELRNGEFRDFLPGEMFIAEDFLEQDVEQSTSLHGHRAQVIGDTDISVLHLKLSHR